MTRNLIFTLCLCLFAVCTGCDSITAVGKDKYNKLDKYLKDKTVLERANVKLEEAKQSRKKLTDFVKQRNVDIEVSKRQVRPLEEEREKSRKAFETTQDAAKAAGLPRQSEAAAADNEKQIQIAGKNLSGRDVYQKLITYKREVQKLTNKIDRENAKQSFWAQQAEKIERQFPNIDRHIDEIEQQIEDYKVYQELLAANTAINDLNIPDSKVEQILNTDDILSELKRKVDTVAAELDVQEKTSNADDLKDAINAPDTPSITGDDLV